MLPMERTARFALAAMLALVLPAAAARAQDTTSTANLRPSPDSEVVVLVLADGSTLVGRVIEVTPTTVRMLSTFGESSVARSAIREVQRRSPAAVHSGELWPEDPSRTRLFFAPTGRTLRGGEAYLADAYVLFPSVQFGLTDYLTVGGGMSLIPGLGPDEQVVYFTPKVRVYSNPMFSMSVGALMAGVAKLTSESPVGVLYGVGTYGTEDASVTVGAGWGYQRTTADQHAVIVLGGSTRTTRNVALVTENYFYTGGGVAGLLSGGVRMMSERIAVDLAGFTTTSLSGIPVPYVSFLYKF